jgi:hypothetical protein
MAVMIAFPQAAIVGGGAVGVVIVLGVHFLSVPLLRAWPTSGEDCTPTQKRIMSQLSSAV